MTEWQKTITRRIQLINLVALICIVIGLTDRDSSNPDTVSTGQTLLKVGIMIFLTLTVAQVGFLIFGWLRIRRISKVVYPPMTYRGLQI